MRHTFAKFELSTVGDGHEGVGYVFRVDGQLGQPLNNVVAYQSHQYLALFPSERGLTFDYSPEYHVLACEMGTGTKGYKPLRSIRAVPSSISLVPNSLAVHGTYFFPLLAMTSNLHLNLVSTRPNHALMSDSPFDINLPGQVLVIEEPPIDTLTPFAIPRDDITSRDHEVGHDAVNERRLVVERIPSG